MADSSRVRIAENFQRNLDGVSQFLGDAGAPEVFDGLLGELFDRVIPTLEEFPEIGIDFLGRRPASQEGLARIERLRRRLSAGESLREYIFGDYLILYAARRDHVVLLAIKHHRQLSFDLRGHWGGR
jgi:hypothetical protein